MEINKKLVTKNAKNEMIDVHSQKYIKAWIDTIQFKEKMDSLLKDWEILSPASKERVEKFIDQRIGNPEGKMVPEDEIAAAVSVKLGMDTCAQNLRQAEMEFDFFAKVIKMVTSI